MLHSFSTLALDTGEGSSSCPGMPLYSRETWTVRRAQNIVPRTGIRAPDRPSRALVTVPIELVIFHFPHSVWINSLICLLFASLRIPFGGGGGRVGPGPSGVRIPLETSGFSLPQNVQTGSGAQRNPHIQWVLELFPGTKADGA